MLWSAKGKVSPLLRCVHQDNGVLIDTSHAKIRAGRISGQGAASCGGSLECAPVRGQPQTTVFTGHGVCGPATGERHLSSSAS